MKNCRWYRKQEKDMVETNHGPKGVCFTSKFAATKNFAAMDLNSKEFCNSPKFPTWRATRRIGDDSWIDFGI